MARPKCCRRIAGEPARNIFKPVGIPLTDLEEIILTMDEFEAIRLADLEGLYHSQAALQMRVSRQTFGRIISSARNKVARALAGGYALHIEGGVVEKAQAKSFECGQCHHAWAEPFGAGRIEQCPACKANNIFRTEKEKNK